MESLIPQDASEFLEQWLGHGWTAEVIAGDASARRYFRVTSPGGSSCVLAYYPDSLRDGVSRFLEAYRAISSHARVPQVITHYAAAIAQHDVGDATLFDFLHQDSERAVEFYRMAIDLLVAFQKSPESARELNPPFDRQKFRDELEMTSEYYVGQLMGRGDQTAALSTIYESLAKKLARHPYMLCHRDYHGQNLHIFNDTLYMIDYQDLRMGPDTYDLASLLRDRGVARLLGEVTEEELLTYYRACTGGDDAMKVRYYESLLQRSIKAIGTFAKQAITRGRRHYLGFIPPTLESIAVCIGQLPEYRPLLDHFPMEFEPESPADSHGGEP